jgi:hypothetical protein
VHVPLTKAELEGLVALAGHGKTIPLTPSTDTRVDSGFALNADAFDADWALAALANLRLDVGLRLAGALDEQLPATVNESDDRGLTDQEADRLRTVISGALGRALPQGSDSATITEVATAVRAWLETLT